MRKYVRKYPEPDIMTGYPTAEDTPRYNAYDLLFPDERSEADKQIEALAAELTRVREQLVMAQGLHERLQADNEALQAQARWYGQLWGNPRLGTGVKLTAYHVWREMDRRLPYRRLDGSIPIAIGRLATASGQGPNTITRHLLALVAMGAITRTVERIGGRGSKRNRQSTSEGKGKGKKPVPVPALPAPAEGEMPGTRVSLSPGILFYEPGRWQRTNAGKLWSAAPASDGGTQTELDASPK